MKSGDWVEGVRMHPNHDHSGQITEVVSPFVFRVDWHVTGGIVSVVEHVDGLVQIPQKKEL